jgi:DNA-binding beta-propeller fold protein YncE
MARGVCVNPSDGTVWAASGASVMHLTPDGAILSQTDGFSTPHAVSADAGDGSCWVADLDHHQVVHLGEDGRELWRGGGDGGLLRPIDISANSTDGSCWVVYQGDIDTKTFTWVGKALLHLARDGAELWRTTSFLTPYAVAVDPNDGSCWVADEYNLIHLSADGQELWSGTGFWEAGDIVVDGRDSSCWVADSLHDRVVHVGADGQILAQSSFTGLVIGVSLNPADGTLWVLELSPGPTWAGGLVHLAADGSELWRGGSFDDPLSVAVSPLDGSCWVADCNNGRLAHFAASGVELPQASCFFYLGAGYWSTTHAVSVNPSDGSCWVADQSPTGYGKVVHLSKRGMELWQREDIPLPVAVSVDSADGSCWIASDGYLDGADQLVYGTLMHIDAEGREFWRGGQYYHPWSIEANPTDGSCWVADEGLWDAGAGDFVESGVYHIAADGTEVWSGRDFSGPFSISVSPSDGSCWVSDTYHDRVVRLAADGTELWRMGGFSMPNSIAVNLTDSTAWVADCYSHQIVHLGADGKDLFRGDVFLYPHAMAVNWKDGSVWVGVNNVGPLMHFAADGSLLWRAWGSFSNGDIAVNQADGSVWSVDDYDMQLVHYVYPRFTDVPFEQWAYVEIDACAETGIVAGYPDGTYQPSLPVTRDQMAVYISRALAGGDAEVPSGPAVADFPDVPIDYWAYRYIEYCYAQQIVAGYSDGYRPQEPVTRDQMAVYVARSIVSPTGDAGLANYTPPATPDFPDVSTTFWAYKYIEYCKSHMIVQGFPDGTYHPEYVVTRDQMAVYIQRAFQLPL